MITGSTAGLGFGMAVTLAFYGAGRPGPEVR